MQRMHYMASPFIIVNAMTHDQVVFTYVDSYILLQASPGYCGPAAERYLGPGGVLNLITEST